MPRQITIGPNTPIASIGGRPPRVVLILLIQQVGFFILWAFANGPEWVRLHLAASAAATFGRHELWQPFTALWVHLGGRSLILNALALWMFGSSLERWWGGRRFLLFWITTGVLGLAAGVAVGLLQPEVALSGSSGSTMAMMVAFAILFPRHMVFFYGLIPLRARVFGLLLVAFVGIGSLISREWLDMAAQLGGAGAALIFLVRPRKRARAAEREPSRPRLQVIQGGKREEKRYIN